MLQEITFNSLAEYVAAVRRLARSWDVPPGNIWYRGLEDLGFGLVPGAVWRELDRATEASMIGEFLVYYRSYTGRHPVDGLELYVLMRHYGLPTRLLDWSMSPLVSLFFALEKPPQPGSRRVVWAMDHVQLNETAIGTAHSIIPGVDRRALPRRWLPPMLRYGEDGDEAIPKEVFAFKHPLSNPRILAQKGCFTFHGSGRQPIEEIFAAAGSERLAKLVLEDDGQREEILGELYELGYKEDDIYQDLGALSRRIMREHGLLPAADAHLSSAPR
jgi:hypothetical protein